MAVTIERQSSISGLPLASTWQNCSSAASCTCVDAPPARSASLKASMMSVALPTSLTVGTIFWTDEVMASRRVGRPVRWSLILSMDEVAASAPYPRPAMTLGKLFMVSTRLIAESSDLLMAVKALPVTAETMPATAPTLAPTPELKAAPVLAPALEPMPELPAKALSSCRLIDDVRLSNFGVSSTEPLATVGKG